MFSRRLESMQYLHVKATHATLCMPKMVPPLVGSSPSTAPPLTAEPPSSPASKILLRPSVSPLPGEEAEPLPRGCSLTTSAPRAMYEPLPSRLLRLDRSCCIDAAEDAVLRIVEPEALLVLRLLPSPLPFHRGLPHSPKASFSCFRAGLPPTCDTSPSGSSASAGDRRKLADSLLLRLLSLVRPGE